MRTSTVLLISLAISGHAWAETSDAAVAEALFQAGRKNLEQGRVGEACEKFSESQRLEPKLGTLLNLAACHETLGMTASAWAEFTQARSLCRAPQRGDHRAFAEQHLRSLSKHLSTVNIGWEVSVPGASVELDGLSIGPAALNTDLPVDPGDHVVQGSAPGRTALEYRFSAEAGPARQSIVIPELAREPSAPLEPTLTLGSERTPVPAPRAARTPEPPPQTPSPVHPSSKKGSHRSAAIPVLITGGLALAVGTVAGFHAISLKRAAQRECSGEACSQRGLDLYSELHTSANISTVAFSVAIAALGTGTYLLLSAPTGSRGTATLALGGTL